LLIYLFIYLFIYLYLKGPTLGKVRNDGEGRGAQRKDLGRIKRKHQRTYILLEPFEPLKQMWKHKITCSSK
ncbi:MAG: hypothetical protein O7D30_11655, partial [Rickettsia endosymbiont of Ixodes persulcatus]|nr:hypothetical protein [Rickettsia endosymbiont of Ixodes persulcatus]